MNTPHRAFTRLDWRKRIKWVHTGALAVFAVLTACSTAPKQAPQDTEYPTQARVEYVLQCMERNGGQNYDTLYPCVCSIDKIATQLSYGDFTEAQTFTFMRSAPGEAGGLFRDPPRAKELRKRLKEAESLAKKACFVKPR